MACFKPLDVFQRADGRGRLLFLGPDLCGSVPEGYRPIQVPCNACIGCKQDYARIWGIRCTHEAQMHERNCFITLTYGSPSVRDLCYPDFQAFLKAFRSELSCGARARVRFFMAGEYGAGGRPHYHACVFGWDFPDRVPWAKSARGHQMYRSEMLESHWSHGFSVVQDFGPGTAQYCAKYAAKAVASSAHVDVLTGEVRPKEFVRMSRRPGIGAEWLEKFHADVYGGSQGDVVQPGGYRSKAPRFYDRMYLEIDGDSMEYLSHLRELRASFRVDDGTRERLGVREVVAQAKFAFNKKESI